MYHYDPETAMEELRDDAILPNPVHLRDMILRVCAWSHMPRRRRPRPRHEQLRAMVLPDRLLTRRRRRAAARALHRFVNRHCE